MIVSGGLAKRATFGLWLLFMLGNKTESAETGDQVRASKLCEKSTR